MEYIEGVNIEEYIQSFPQKINSIFIQVIDGFKYLEEKKILHRDIRPSNILVSNDDIVKIIDFGFGKTIQNIDDYEKSITLNWAYTLPNDFSIASYDFKTEIYFLGKLFEHMITNNNLGQAFKYNIILDKMINRDHEARISSFYNISREITSEDSQHIGFSNDEKKIYINIANSFMSVCSRMDFSTKYKEEIKSITKSLDDLLQKSALENCVQNNNFFIECFINPPYRCNKKPLIPVKYLSSFIGWWKNLPNSSKIIVLNNLWTRFDTITRETRDDLPF